jgi:hypothetical protein
MKWLLIACSMLLPTGDTDRDPRPAPTRWQQPAERLPRPDADGDCPGSFEAWVYDKRRGAICVRRA